MSGSGKSTLVNSILKKSHCPEAQSQFDKPGKFESISGIEHLDRLIDIDQSPIGRTPRSNPATYTGVFDDIRHSFAQTNEAKIRGYKRGVSPLTSKVDGVKPVQETVSSRLKCTFCRMSLFHVRFVMGIVTIQKR